MARLSYRRHRFPPEIIQHAIWLYLRLTLSYRDVEELLAKRGLDVSYETVRRWVLKFGPLIARKLRQRRPRPSDRRTWTRWLFGSPASGCTSGVPSTTKARSSTCWSRVAGQPVGVAVDAQASQKPRVCAEIAGDQQAALLWFGVPAVAADLPS
jgi:hypothetical protein